MKNFMEPKSVALIGISRKSGPGSFNIMENMVRFGFQGKIFPVNPNTKEILGEKAYPNIRSVKEDIDLAVISTPRETTVNILHDCVAAKVKAAIVVNQGFTDADSLGKEMQQEISIQIFTPSQKLIDVLTFQYTGTFPINLFNDNIC